jgi:hypothetical protein
MTDKSQAKQDYVAECGASFMNLDKNGVIRNVECGSAILRGLSSVHIRVTKVADTVSCT